jgi:CheY-like chemotaxis protein
MNAARAFVLVVDDLPDAADGLADLVTLWGYDGAAYYCGACALVAATARPPAAVLLDLGMASMDGFEFALQLRRLPGCGGTPLVAVTGHTSQSYRDRARAAGVGHYLLKPAEPAVVQALLARLTAGLEVATPPAGPSDSLPTTAARHRFGSERGEEVRPLAAAAARL